MRLSSARDLKSTITGDPRWVRSRADPAIHMAVGITLGDDADSHRIAVRAPDPKSVDEELLEQIRKEAKGEVEVHYTGPLVVERAETGTVKRKLKIGASIGHYSCSAGTIGFFARRISDGTFGLVSNNHVLAAEDRGKDDDEILHPAPADSGTSPNDVVACLAGDYPRLRENTTVDCAFGKLVRGVACDPGDLGVTGRLRHTVIRAEKQLDVAKIGRTTGLTTGRITAIDIDFMDVEYSIGYVSFFDQIEIEAVSETPFCRPGDSGSLVFTRELEPVGLLFLGTRAGGAFNCGRGYANPIGEVLRTLNVTFA
jgi:hypothetical protein